MTVDESDSNSTDGSGKTAEPSPNVPGLDSPSVSLAVDTQAPTIAGVSSTKAAGTYGAGTTIPVTMTFSEPVTVTGTPQVALNAGSGAVARYTGEAALPR